MKYVKNFVICLIVIELFFFLGGGLLFDLSSNYYRVGFTYAVIAATMVSVYEHQESKIEALEKRVNELENKE